jgi:hypothetical protein
MKNSENRNSKNILSSWLPKREEISSGDPSLESKKNALTWLGVETLPIENSTPTSPSPSQEKASTWLEVDPLKNSTPTTPSLGNALAWLGGDPLENSAPTSPSPSLKERPQISISQPILPEEKPSITTKIATIPDFNQTIIQMFGGQPIRVVPPIQNQRNGQSMLDFLGRGLAIQGPASHSQPLTSSHQKHSVNQRSLLDFMTNPFASPSSTIVAPNGTKPNKIQRIYC